MFCTESSASVGIGAVSISWVPPTEHKGGWSLTRVPSSPRVSDKPALGLLREGLKLFISHFLLRGAPEAGALRERAKLCTQALQGQGSLRM